MRKKKIVVVVLGRQRIKKHRMVALTNKRKSFQMTVREKTTRYRERHQTTEEEETKMDMRQKIEKKMKWTRRPFSRS